MRGWKATVAFFTSSLAMDVAAAIFLVALPYLAMDFGATSLTLGILAACRAVVYISTIPIFGHFSDRGNRKGFIIAGVMVAIAMSSAMALTGNLTQLFVVAILWTLSGALFWPSLFGWTGDAHKPEELAKGTGTVNVGWTIGAMLGFFAGGVLYEVRPSLPFLCAVVPAALAAIVFLPFPFRRILHSHAPHVERRHVRRRELLAIWLGNFAVFAMSGLFDSVFPGLGKGIGVTPVIFGAFLCLTGFARSIIFFGGFWWSRMLRDWRLAVATQTLAAIAVGTVWWASAHWWLAVVYGLIGLAGGISYYRGSYSSLATVGARGFRSALIEASAMGGTTVGALGGGILASLAGLRAPYIPCAILAVALAVTQTVLIVTAHRAHAGKSAAT